MVAIVDGEAATGPAIVEQGDSYTRHQACVPGNLTVSKHPGPGRQPIGPEAGACKAGPVPTLARDCIL